MYLVSLYPFSQLHILLNVIQLLKALKMIFIIYPRHHDLSCITTETWHVYTGSTMSRIHILGNLWKHDIHDTCKHITCTVGSKHYVMYIFESIISCTYAWKDYIIGSTLLLELYFKVGELSRMSRRLRNVIILLQSSNSGDFESIQA